MDPDKTYCTGSRRIGLHLSENESKGHWQNSDRLAADLASEAMI